MRCPLCNKMLLEIEDGVDTDFICSERVAYSGKMTYPHYEDRAEDNYVIVRAPPYMLIIRDNYTDVWTGDYTGKYKDKFICLIASLNKSNIDKFTNNYKNMTAKIKNLIIFS